MAAASFPALDTIKTKLNDICAEQKGLEAYSLDEKTKLISSAIFNQLGISDAESLGSIQNTVRDLLIDDKIEKNLISILEKENKSIDSLPLKGKIQVLADLIFQADPDAKLYPDLYLDRIDYAMKGVEEDFFSLSELVQMAQVRLRAKNPEERGTSGQEAIAFIKEMKSISQSGKWEMPPFTRIFTAFEQASRIVELPPELHDLHQIFALPYEKIIAISDEAAQQLPNPSAHPQEKSKQTMSFLLKHLSHIKQQLKDSRTIFEDMNDATVTDAGKQLEANSKFTGALNPAEKDFIKIGYNLTPFIRLGQDAIDSFSPKDFWHAHIFTPTQQEVLRNRENWVLKASEAFENVIADTVHTQRSNHPMNMHKEMTDLMKDKETMLLPQGKRITTRQFLKDNHRYNQLILRSHDDESSAEKSAAVEYPGHYQDTTATAGDIYNRLEKIANGSQDLLYLLQEAMCQNATKLVTEHWLYQELDARTGIDKSYGFIMLTPYNESIAIHKVSKTSIMVEYDYNLRTTNQFIMETVDDPADCMKYYKFRVQYNIERNEDGNWIIQQPKWINIENPKDTLVAKHNPNPVLVDENLRYHPEAISKINQSKGKTETTSSSSSRAMSLEIET